MRRSKYHCTEAIDTVLRTIYNDRTGRKDDPIPSLSEYAETLGWPATVLKNRASQLGLCRPKEKHWSPPEQSLLERFAHLSDKTIQRRLEVHGYTRSIFAIRKKLWRERLKKNLPFFTATDLAECLGMQPHQISKWIRLGYLKATPKGTERTQAQGGDVYLIKDTDLKQFLISNPTLWNIRRADHIWILDLLTDGMSAA